MRALLIFVITFSLLLIIGTSSTFAASNNVKFPVGWNDGKRAIASEILTAYSNDLERINQIADNADYALLALAAYEDNINANDTDLDKLLKQRNWESWDCNVCVNKNLIVGDTTSRLFRNRKTREFVLAFRGTTGLSDWITNIKGTTDDIDPLSTAQLKGAKDISKSIVEMFSPLTFVGHSLGGRLAAIGMLESERKAVVFNSSPFGEYEKNNWSNTDAIQKEIMSFRSPDDPLRKISKFQDVEIKQVVSVGKTSYIGLINKRYRTQAHGMAVIAEVLQNVRLARDEGWISAHIAEKNGDLVSDSENVAKSEQRKQDSTNATSEHTQNEEVDQNVPNTNNAGASLNSGMINIDSPKELKVSCDSKKPAYTDIVISVNGLEQNKAYELLLKGYGLGYRYIYPNRTNEPKIFTNAYAGHYVAEVWFQKSNIKNRKLIASKEFIITRPQLELLAPAKITENTPIKITLSNVISPFRRNLSLTVVPVNYHLKKFAELRRVINCKPAEHTFRGLPSGQYEARLINIGLRETSLIAKQPITVTGK